MYVWSLSELFLCEQRDEACPALIPLHLNALAGTHAGCTMRWHWERQVLTRRVPAC
jgi:hypothetical protein